MAALKQSVGPFELESSESGSHRYVNRQDLGQGQAFVYPVELFREGGSWVVLTGLYGEGFDRQSEQVQSVERFGSPMHHADSFEGAKRKAYAFMRAFSGSPGYNGLISRAEQAGFRDEAGRPVR
jgi:hypothetical protein